MNKSYLHSTLYIKWHVRNLNSPLYILFEEYRLFMKEKWKRRHDWHKKEHNCPSYSGHMRLQPRLNAIYHDQSPSGYLTKRQKGQPFAKTGLNDEKIRNLSLNALGQVRSYVGKWYNSYN